MAIIFLPKNYQFINVVSATREVIAGVRYNLFVNARNENGTDTLCNIEILEKPWITVAFGEKLRTLEYTNCTSSEYNSEQLNSDKNYNFNPVFVNQAHTITDDFLKLLEQQILKPKIKPNNEATTGKSDDDLLKILDGQIIPIKITTTTKPTVFIELTTPPSTDDIITIEDDIVKPPTTPSTSDDIITIQDEHIIVKPKTPSTSDDIIIIQGEVKPTTPSTTNINSDIITSLTDHRSDDNDNLIKLQDGQIVKTTTTIKPVTIENVITDPHPSKLPPALDDLSKSFLDDFFKVDTNIKSNTANVRATEIPITNVQTFNAEKSSVIGNDSLLYKEPVHEIVTETTDIKSTETLLQNETLSRTTTPPSLPENNATDELINAVSTTEISPLQRTYLPVPENYDQMYPKYDNTESENILKEYIEKRVQSIVQAQEQQSKVFFAPHIDGIVLHLSDTNTEQNNVENFSYATVTDEDMHVGQLTSQSTTSDETIIRKTRQLNEINTEKEYILHLTYKALEQLDHVDSDEYKRIVIDIIHAKKIQKDNGTAYIIKVRTGNSHCIEESTDVNKCAMNLVKDSTKVCNIEVNHKFIEFLN